MEASTILKMVDNVFYNCFFIIDVIVGDDDSTMRSELKHPSIGVRGQVLKTSKGKLDEGIPDPSFLTDSSHRVNVVAKQIFPSSTKLGLINVGAPNQMLSNSRKIGGT